MSAIRRYFGTDGVRGTVGESLVNPEFVLKLGWAVGKVLANGSRKKVLIGKDTRVSGYMLESVLEAGLAAAGVDIQLLGPMPTPAIAYLTRTLRASAGIVISASHNLYQDNGIKFFSAEGRKLPDALELEIEAVLDQPMQSVRSIDLGKAQRVNDAPGRYIEFCKSTIPSITRLSGLKIIVDCANGATYHIAPNVFEELGADVTAVAIDPDGFNINAECGSTKPELLQQVVLSQGADLGIAFDGDGDRVIMVDNRGELLDGDELLYIIVRDRLLGKQLQGGVVGTVMTNYGFELAMKSLEIAFHRSAVGDRYVMDALVNNDWQIGGESSGHIICLDKTTTGDGIVSALQVLFAMARSGKPLSELKSGLEKLPQTTVNVNIQGQDGADLVAAASVVAEVEAVQNELKNQGRVLIRPSGTEPLVRVMVEGIDEDSVSKYAQQIADVVSSAASSM